MSCRHEYCMINALGLLYIHESGCVQVVRVSFSYHKTCLDVSMKVFIRQRVFANSVLQDCCFPDLNTNNSSEPCVTETTRRSKPVKCKCSL